MFLDERTHRGYMYKAYTIAVLSILILIMIYFFKNASFLLRAISSVAVLLFFYFTDRFFDIRFKIRHYMFVIIVVISSLLLSPLYYVYPHYDKIQHVLQPILLASIILHIVLKQPIRIRWKLLFVLFATISFITVLELGEYALDLVFDLKLQGVYLRDFGGLEKFNLILNQNDDTMIDLTLCVLGSLVYILYVGFGILFKQRR